MRISRPIGFSYVSSDCYPPSSGIPGNGSLSLTLTLTLRSPPVFVIFSKPRGFLLREPNRLYETKKPFGAWRGANSFLALIRRRNGSGKYRPAGRSSIDESCDSGTRVARLLYNSESIRRSITFFVNFSFNLFASSSLFSSSMDDYIALVNLARFAGPSHVSIEKEQLV